MLGGGAQLALVIFAPLLGALLTHELRRRSSLVSLAAAVAIAATAAVTVTVAASLGAGGELEHSFGTAVAGVDLTLRADAASAAIILIAAIAAAVAMPHLLREPVRVTGILLALAATTMVATAGTLVQVAAGVELAAVGALLSGGRASAVRLTGSRTAAVVGGLLGVAALGLLTAAVELIGAAGSNDLAFVPAGTIGNAVAVPWALAGVALLVVPTLVGSRSTAAAHWPAICAAPAGFLILLRLQQTAGGQLPPPAAVCLGVVGALVALAGARAALASTSLEAAAGAVIAVLSGLLVSEMSRSLAHDGTLMAGLFLALELGWLSSYGWHRRPTAWSAASAALMAFPGGAAVAVALVAVGGWADAGVSGYPQLLVLTGALATVAVAVARRVQTPPHAWRTMPAGTAIAVVAGLVGGMLPGQALRALAPALAGGGRPVDVDGAAVQGAGASWAGGYLTIALALVVVAAASALLLAGDEIAGVVPVPEAVAVPHLRALLAVRRRIRAPQERAGAALHAVDHWLEVQPQVTAVIIVAAVAILVFR